MGVKLNSAYLELGSAVKTAVPLTLATWFNRGNAVAGSQTLLALSASTGNSNGFRIIMNTGVMQCTLDSNSSAFVTASSQTLVTSNAGPWHHAVGIFTSATQRQAYLDGLPGDIDTRSATPAVTVDRTLIGAKYSNGSIVNTWSVGDLFDSAIWGTALTGAEVLDLFFGRKRPNQVGGGTLIAWLPFGMQSAGWQTDLAKGNLFTNNGGIPTLTKPPKLRTVVNYDSTYVSTPPAPVNPLNLLPLLGVG